MTFTPVGRQVPSPPVFDTIRLSTMKRLGDKPLHLRSYVQSPPAVLCVEPTCGLYGWSLRSSYGWSALSPTRWYALVETPHAQSNPMGYFTSEKSKRLRGEQDRVILGDRALCFCSGKIRSVEQHGPFFAFLVPFVALPFGFFGGDFAAL